MMQRLTRRQAVALQERLGQARCRSARSPAGRLGRRRTRRGRGLRVGGGSVEGVLTSVVGVSLPCPQRRRRLSLVLDTSSSSNRHP